MKENDMSIIFDVRQRPLINKAGSGTATGQEHGQLAQAMMQQEGLIFQRQAVRMQLQRGAWTGDPWCMGQLARSYYDQSRELLPHALCWWRRAAVASDRGALEDLQRLPIEADILQYRSNSSEFADMVLRCAMLAEWVLTDLGRTSWSSLSFASRLERVQRLFDKVVPVLHLNGSIQLQHQNVLPGQRPDVGGLARWQQRAILIRDSIFDGYSNLIRLSFHELGHFVQFSMWDPDTASSRAQQQRFGVTRERVLSWRQKAEYPASLSSPIEVDADTLAYNVLMAWTAFFGRFR